MDNVQLKITGDGSHTIYLTDLDETYHSVHGSIQEAKHVFIKNGLHSFNQEKLNILEIGLGTGLNALLTCIDSTNSIYYTGIDAFPIERKLIDQLNFTEELSLSDDESVIFNTIHDVNWNTDDHIKITKSFCLKKIKELLNDYQPLSNQFDLIYFDAFGPRVQPDLWTEKVFRKMYSALKKGGILVTYCAKGEVKRTLKKIGFKVESLPGPPGKREMTRGTK